MLALVVATFPQTPGAEGDGYEHRPGFGRREETRDGGGEVVGDARQTPVLERMSGLPRAFVQPHGGAGLEEGRRPLAAQSAGAEVRARLAAALAPRADDRPPAVAADVADEMIGDREVEEAVAQQALRREEELLEGVRHGARGRRRRA